jgi:hypothetical protein
VVTVVDDEAMSQSDPRVETPEQGGDGGDGGDGGRTLAQLGRESARLHGELHAAESARHRSVLEQLVRAEASLADALRDVQVKPSDRYVDTHPATPADLGRLPVLDAPAHSLGLEVRGRPFDFDWHDAQDWGTPDANRDDGTMSLQVDSGGTPGDTSGTWNGSGVGIHFRPRRGVSFMRVAGYLPYAFRWHDDSTLQVAHNRGEVGILIREIGGRTVLDHREGLWSDGTSWYQEHGGDGDGVFNSSSFVFVTPERPLEIWFWVNSGIDYTHESSDFFSFSTSSSASNDLQARLGFIVVEQFGS